MQSLKEKIFSNLSSVNTTDNTTTDTTHVEGSGSNTPINSKSNVEGSAPNTPKSTQHEKKSHEHNEHEHEHNDTDEDDQDHLLPMSPPQYPSYSPPESPSSRQWEYKRWY